MPFKDPEKEKEYRREQSRLRRARAKASESGASLPPVAEAPAPASKIVTPEIIMYRIFNRITKTFWEGHASSPQEACEKVPWQIEYCWVRHESGKGGWINDTPQVSLMAIAQGKAGGGASKPANSPPPAPRAESPELDNPLARAEKVAARTRELLDTRGWVIWKCSLLNDEKVLIVRDESVTDAPTGYPVYLEKELETIGDMTDWSVRMVHQAKKLAGARLL
jgi:hypothetical protein